MHAFVVELPYLVQEGLQLVLVHLWLQEFDCDIMNVIQPSFVDRPKCP